MEVFQSLIVPSSFPMCFLTYSYLHFSLLWCSVGTCFFITVSVKLWLLFLAVTSAILLTVRVNMYLLCITALCVLVFAELVLWTITLLISSAHYSLVQVCQSVVFPFSFPVCFLTFSQLHFPRLLCLVGVWFCAYVFCQSRNVSLAVTCPMSLTVGVTMHVICIPASCLLVIATAKPLATTVCNILIPTFYIYLMNKSEILINLGL